VRNRGRCGRAAPEGAGGGVRVCVCARVGWGKNGPLAHVQGARGGCWLDRRQVFCVWGREKTEAAVGKDTGERRNLSGAGPEGAARVSEELGGRGAGAHVARRAGANGESEGAGCDERKGQRRAHGAAGGATRGREAHIKGARRGRRARAVAAAAAPARAAAKRRVKRPGGFGRGAAAAAVFPGRAGLTRFDRKGVFLAPGRAKQEGCRVWAPAAWRAGCAHGWAHMQARAAARMGGVHSPPCARVAPGGWRAPPAARAAGRSLARPGLK
jgi:hypothetical protein